jgi:hypothetical protein
MDEQAGEQAQGKKCRAVPQSLPPRLCPEILDSLLWNAKPEPELKSGEEGAGEEARDVRQQQLKLD